MRFFKNNLFVILAALFINTYAFSQYPQVVLCLGIDDTVCLGQPVQIQDCAGVGGTVGSPTSAAYNIASIPFAPDPLTSGTSVFLSDDAQTAMIPIGFPFCFYGNTYTQFIIGSNNFITFSAGNSATWVTTPVPNAGFVPKNAIMGPWQDINPGIGGTVKYQMYGTAPFRRMSISWNNVPMFSCTGQLYSSQIIIYETTNVIETHIVNKSVCAGWNSGNAVHSLHNITGTAAVTVPGRNNTQWTATNEGTRFTPGALGIQWGNTLGQTFPYNNGVLNIASVPSGTTGYFLKSACAGNAAISDTTWLTRSVVSATASSISDTCGAGYGSATVVPVGNGPFTITWVGTGQTTPTATNLTTGTYTANVADNFGCLANATTTIGNVSATSYGTTTQVTCAAGSDGTASAFMSPLGVNTTYLWSDANAQTTQTATGLVAGNYTCTISSDNGCTQIVAVTVTEIPALTVTVSNQQNVSCHAANNGVINLSVADGTTPYTYVWSGSSSTGSIANDLFVGPQQVTVTDFNNCTVTINTTLSEPPALYIDSISTDTMICQESSILIGAVGAGGSTPYIYTWYQNGTQFSNSQYVLVDPVNSGTEYTLVLSEVCGSPTATDSLTVTFPQDIIPLIVPDPYEACAPYTFNFINNSTNGGDIDFSVYNFSNGATQTITGMNNVNQLFDFAGMYDLQVTVTSIHGCVYTQNFPQIISALQRPKAQFNMTTNPTTIFETKVGMIDKSIDPASWVWYAPDATPSTSTLTNPEFTFPTKEGNYEVNLLVTSPKGCVDSTKGVLIVKSDIIIYAPNTFTPDGDQFNQTWHVVTDGLDAQDFEIEVYNRWGEVVWRSLDMSAEWDGTYAGKIVPQGQYNWKMRSKKVGSDEPQIYTGSVLIIR